MFRDSQIETLKHVPPVFFLISQQPKANASHTIHRPLRRKSNKESSFFSEKGNKRQGRDDKSRKIFAPVNLRIEHRPVFDIRNSWRWSHTYPVSYEWNGQGKNAETLS